ncbi:MAG: tRNA (guanine(26)-N(2))-dimethyltransferase [Desulfurococcaceae archaeon]
MSRLEVQLATNTLLKKEVLIREGLAQVVVPNPEFYRRPDGVVEPAWMPVFYNPRAVLNRDLSVLFLKIVMRERDFFFVDALSGTGVRGIRIALEVGGHGVLNDVDARAYYYMRKNILLNNLAEKLEAYNHEANALLNTITLSGIYVDYVDIDPYGSPAPFIDSALKPIGKEAFLGITATDVASLSCTYPHKTQSRYWSECIKVDFDKEFAARLLIANTVLRAAALEVALQPQITVVHEHYVRVFFKAKRSALEAYKLVNNCVGYLWFCKSTLERGFVISTEDLAGLSCLDGSKPSVMGKVWICNIQAPQLVESMLPLLKETPWLSNETVKLGNTLAEEAKIAQPYYRLDKLCSVLGLSMPKMSILIDKLKEQGIGCSRTHMDPRGVRVDAPYSELVSLIKSLQTRS